MLDGLSALELGRLRLSVGYGTHKKGRPLSPMEVAEHIGRAKASGNSAAKCAIEIRIDVSGLGRFLRLLKLPDDLRHLVDWGGGRDVLGFSHAFELVKIAKSDDMRAVSEAILEHGLTKQETGQIAQILERSGRPVREVLEEVLGMRPVVEKKYIFIGSVTNPKLVNALKEKSQRERNVLLAGAMDQVRLIGATGRMGTSRLTLVGDESFGTSLSAIGKDRLEGLLCEVLEKELENATTGS